MKISIRIADLNIDREAIVNFSKEFLTSEASLIRFNWLYLENPFGVAKTWIAYDDLTREMVGISAAFPRLVSISGNGHICWVLGDFCIHPSCRSLGPALLLQKACLNDLETEERSFVYDFPSSRMMAIYKRIGISSCDTHVRFVKPLRIDHKIKQTVRWKSAATGLAKIGNLALQFGEWSFRGSQDDVTRHEGVCGDEFSILFERARSFYPICLVRTSDYLNWRYISNPLENYDVWTYRREGVLKGYVVALQKDEGVQIVDFLSERSDEILKRLFLVISRYYRQEGVQSLDCCFPASHPFIKILKELHFIEREGNPVVVCGKQEWIAQINKTQDYLWWLTSGDRDS